MCMTDEREGGPTLFAQIKNGVGVEDVVRLILSAWRAAGASEK
jgi:urease accessory protein